MNKSELIEALARERGISGRDAGDIVNTIINAMAEALARGEHIEIRGFGSFMVKDYMPYEGRNPKTGEKITVKPKKLPCFKLGKELRQRLKCLDDPEP